MARKKSQHTPGPWYIGVGEKYCFHEGNRVAICAAGSGEGTEQTVAEVWPAAGRQDIADGRLIAAAPDMLAVLDQLADQLPELDDADAPLAGSEAVTVLCAVWPALQAARRKARGGRS